MVVDLLLKLLAILTINAIAVPSHDHEGNSHDVLLRRERFEKEQTIAMDSRTNHHAKSRRKKFDPTAKSGRAMLVEKRRKEIPEIVGASEAAVEKKTEDVTGDDGILGLQVSTWLLIFTFVGIILACIGYYIRQDPARFNNFWLNYLRLRVFLEMSARLANGLAVVLLVGYMYVGIIFYTKSSESTDIDIFEKLFWKVQAFGIICVSLLVSFAALYSGALRYGWAKALKDQPKPTGYDAARRQERARRRQEIIDTVMGIFKYDSSRATMLIVVGLYLYPAVRMSAFRHDKSLYAVGKVLSASSLLIGPFLLVFDVILHGCISGSRQKFDEFSKEVAAKAPPPSAQAKAAAPAKASPAGAPPPAAAPPPATAPPGAAAPKQAPPAPAPPT